MRKVILIFIMILLGGCGSAQTPSSSDKEENPNVSPQEQVLFTELQNRTTVNTLTQNSPELKVTHCADGQALLDSPEQKTLGFYKVSGNSVTYTFDEGDVTVTSSDGAFSVNQNFDAVTQTGEHTSYYLKDIISNENASCSLGIENQFTYDMFAGKTFYVYGYFRNAQAAQNRSTAVYNSKGTRVTIKDTQNQLTLLQDVPVGISLQKQRVYLSLNALQEGATQDYFLKTIGENIYVMETGFNPYPAVYTTSKQSDNGLELLTKFEQSYKLSKEIMQKNPWYVVEFIPNENNEMIVSCPAKSTFSSENIKVEYINEQKKQLTLNGSYSVSDNTITLTNSNNETQTARVIALEEDILTFEHTKYFKNRSEAIEFAQILSILPGTDFCDKNLPQ